MPDDLNTQKLVEAGDPPAPAPTLIHEFLTILEPLNLTEHFPTPQPLEVEFGCGDGSFIVEWANRNRTRNFLAVERLMGMLLIMIAVQMTRDGFKAYLNL